MPLTIPDNFSLLKVWPSSASESNSRHLM